MFTHTNPVDYIRHLRQLNELLWCYIKCWELRSWTNLLMINKGTQFFAGWSFKGKIRVEEVKSFPFLVRTCSAVGVESVSISLWIDTVRSNIILSFLVGCEVPGAAAWRAHTHGCNWAEINSESGRRAGTVQPLHAYFIHPLHTTTQSILHE